MEKNNKKKAIQLGMPHGTAQGKLKKSIMFWLLSRLNLNKCFRCKKKIETIKELSVEHKEHWLDSDDPVGLFFDLDNIAFSHLSCNSGNSRQPNKKYDDPMETHRVYDRKRRQDPE